MSRSVADDREVARALDASEAGPLQRDAFELPRDGDGVPVHYLCGNSLGLMPKRARDRVTIEMDRWARDGVRGHFTGDSPWFSYHETVREAMARVVGARPDEVVVMNGLTVNLHLLLVSFFEPKGERRKILIEANAFPSDRYAAASQIRLRGGNPADDLIELPLRDGALTHHEDDIIACLESRGDEIAVVLLGGVSYLTGQAFPMAAIARAAHACGCLLGLDLAHAAGNLALALHDDDIDFAVWCGYKFLNGGPGGMAGAFVHERLANDKTRFRLAGWWGHDPHTRFQMPPHFDPQPGAASWQLSNCPILATAALASSLELFDAAGGMTPLRARSVRLTSYLESLLDRIPDVSIITPRDPEARGCQLSIRTPIEAKRLAQGLEARRIVCDVREPGIIRAAPVPLYNTFEDVWAIAAAIEEVVGEGGRGS